MMEQKDTKVKSFLESIMPEFEFSGSLDTKNIIEIAAIIFILSVFIIVAFFSLKNYFK